MIKPSKKQAGAPLNNQNRLGRGTKAKLRLQVSLSISDCNEKSPGVYDNLRQRLEDYFLAQIACEIRRVLSEKPRDINVEDFLLKFQEAKKASEKSLPSAAHRKQAAMIGKVSLLAAFGVKNAPLDIGED